MAVGALGRVRVDGDKRPAGELLRGRTRNEQALGMGTTMTEWVGVPECSRRTSAKESSHAKEQTVLGRQVLTPDARLLGEHER